MELAAILSVIEMLERAFGPQIAALVGAHAAQDIASATRIGLNLQADYTLFTQAKNLVAACEAETRDPTDAEMAPFAAAVAASQAAMQMDQDAGAARPGPVPNDSGPNPPDKPR